MKILYSTYYDSYELEKEAIAHIIEEGDECDIIQKEIDECIEQLLQMKEQNFKEKIEDLNIKAWLTIGEIQTYQGINESFSTFPSFWDIILGYSNFELLYNKENEAIILKLYHHDGTDFMKIYSIDNNNLVGDINDYSLSKLKKNSKAITPKMFWN